MAFQGVSSILALRFGIDQATAMVKGTVVTVFIQVGQSQT